MRRRLTCRARARARRQLLSCLRAIEWDLQDLEDHVSIVEGNRAKFSGLEDGVVAARKDLVESVRRKIDAVRSNVQAAASSEPGGRATARAKATSALAAAARLRSGKGFVKLQEDQHEGRGCFSPAAAARSLANGGGGGSGSSLLPGAASGASGAAGGGGGAAGANGGDNGAAQDAASATAKPWWLCCC